MPDKILRAESITAPKAKNNPKGRRKIPKCKFIIPAKAEIKIFPGGFDLAPSGNFCHKIIQKAKD
jgi:hypothetical protein